MKIFFDMIQLLGGLILSLGYIPQIFKIFKTKSVDDFSFNTLKLVAFGIFCMELYAIYNIKVAFMFFITNTLALAIQIIMVMLYMIYRKKENINDL